MGQQEAVQPIALGDASVLIDKALRQGVTRTVTLPESLEAPVAQGQELGTLILESGGKVLAQVPLVAQTAVPRLTWGQLFTSLLEKLLMAGQPD